MSPILYKSVVSGISEARQQLDMTVTAAAKQAGMHRPHWSAIESGGRTASLDTLIRMAETVGKTIRIELL